MDAIAKSTKFDLGGDREYASMKVLHTCLPKYEALSCTTVHSRERDLVAIAI